MMSGQKQVKINKEKLKKIILEILEENIDDPIGVLSRMGIQLKQKEPAKAALEELQKMLAPIDDLDKNSEDEALEILFGAVDVVQDAFHRGGFGAPSPVKESNNINEIVMTQEPLDILDELRGLSNKFSSVSGNMQPFQDMALEMISQINDLEELLTMEEK